MTSLLFLIVSKVPTPKAMFTAAQALEFRKPLKSSKRIEKIVSNYRKGVKFIKQDEVMHDHIIESLKHIETLNIDERLII